MKTISLLLLSLMMVLVNPAFPGTGRNGAGGAMSQDDVTAVRRKVTKRQSKLHNLRRMLHKIQIKQQMLENNIRIF